MVVLNSKNPSSGSPSVLSTPANTSYAAGGLPLNTVMGDYGGGGWQQAYSQSPSPISQNIPGPSGNLPKVSYGSERSPSAASNQNLFNALSGAGGGGGGGGIPSLPPYQPSSLGGSSSGGAGRGGALQGMIQQMASDRAARTQSEMAAWQYKQARGQAAYDKQAVGRLGEGFESMLQNYNESFGQARGANEARYKQMLDITDQTTGQRLADVSSAYNQRGADVQQRLAGLGMANTTVAPTMQFGIDRERQSALNRTADQMQQTKLGIIERRDDNYPDLGSLQSIIGASSSAFGTRGIDAMLKAFGNVRSV